MRPACAPLPPRPNVLLSCDLLTVAMLAKAPPIDLKLITGSRLALLLAAGRGRRGLRVQGGSGAAPGAGAGSSGSSCSSVA